MPVITALSQEVSAWIDGLPWQRFLLVSIQVTVILLLTYALLRWRVRLIRRLFHVTRWEEKKQDTLSKLLLSFSRYLIWFVSIISILLSLEIKVTAILAGAGIAGVALGFGAQTLVKDVINGFFIIFEDQFHVGDYVEINGKNAGTVDELGLRMTRIRLWGGHLIYIPNSEIREVKNYNRGYMRVIATFYLPRDYPVHEAEAEIGQMCEKFTEKYRHNFLITDSGQLVEPASLYGITELEDTDGRGLQYTVTAVVTDQVYWSMANLMRQTIAETFQAAGIEISAPTYRFSPISRPTEF